MAQGIFLIHGAGLPYHVVDIALHWAGEHDASLLGIFIYGDQLRGESYGFPSDIEQVESLNSKHSAQNDLRHLLSGHQQYIEKEAAEAGIELHTVIIRNPGDADLQPLFSQGELVFIDPATFGDNQQYAATDFSYGDIVALCPLPIDEVTDTL